MSLIDKAFLNGAGYDVALPHILALVRDDSPVDSTFPVCLTYKRFRGALMKYLGALLIPDLAVESAFLRLDCHSLNLPA